MPTMLSKEQEHAAQCILKGHNVRILAKAGSGKTRLLLEAAKRFVDATNLHVILLVYNATPKIETRQRLKEMGTLYVQRIHVHTFHSAAQTYFFRREEHVNISSLCETAIKRGVPIPQHYTFLSKLGLVLVDECQDLNTDFVGLIRTSASTAIVLHHTDYSIIKQHLL